MSLKSFKSIAFVISLAGMFGLLWVNIAVLLGKPSPFELSFFHIFFVLFPLWAFTIHYLGQATAPLEEERSNQMDTFQKIRYYLGNPPMWAMFVLAGFYAYAMY